MKEELTRNTCFRYLAYLISAIFSSNDLYRLGICMLETSSNHAGMKFDVVQYSIIPTLVQNIKILVYLILLFLKTPSATLGLFPTQILQQL